jgi:hypothetical protein
VSSSDEDFKLSTPGGVTYRLKSGPTFKADVHGRITGSADFVIHTKNVTKFLKECLPTPRKGTGTDLQTGGQSNILILPRGYCPMLPRSLRPESFSVDAINNDKPLDVFRVDARPRTASGFARTYERLAVVTIDFGTCRESLVDGDLRSDAPQDFLEPSFNVNAEVIAINPNKLTKTGTSTGGDDTVELRDFTTPIIKLVPIVEETYLWTWALDPDFDTIFGMLGHVNESNNTPFLRNAPAQTVMFLGVSGKLEYRWTFNAAFTRDNLELLPPSAYACWRLEFKFARRHIREPVDPSATGEQNNFFDFGWNHIFDPERQEWRRLWRQSASNSNRKRPLYPTNDFVKLFRCLPG